MHIDQHGALAALLNKKVWPEDADVPIMASTVNQEEFVQRAENMPLYAHTYPFFFNLQRGLFRPKDLLTLAYVNALSGCALHIHDGGPYSLGSITTAEREALSQYANELDIQISLETSHTATKHINEIVAVARDMDLHDIRAYSRYEGRVSEVCQRIVEDLTYMAELAEKHALDFYFEQHEELKSTEIVECIEEVGSPRIGILFDFCNMYNAYETPLRALQVMAPHIRQVHIKGARRIFEEGGWSQQGVAFHSEEDEIPAYRLLYELLMLGDSPQVKAFIMEQEVGFYAPAFRKPDEEADPFIAYREPSENILPEGLEVARICREEQRHAIDMIRRVREIVIELKSAVILEK